MKNYETSPTILLVDDDIQTADGMKSFLERRGYRVDVANDQRLALFLFKEKQYDAVFLDIRLDDFSTADNNTSGIDLAIRFREMTPTIGIIFNSAYKEYLSDILVLAKQLGGGIAYLFKGGGSPVKIQDALSRVFDRKVYIDPIIMADLSMSPEDEIINKLPGEERELVKHVLDNFDKLTDREREVLEHIYLIREMRAKVLSMSIKTVDRHMSNIYKKFGLSTGSGCEAAKMDVNVRQDVILSTALLIFKMHGKKK